MPDTFTRDRLTLRESAHGGTDLIEVDGEIDVYSAPLLRERLIKLRAAGRRMVVIDLERCEYLDATGLAVLVGAVQRVRRADGYLSVVCTRESILRIFRITGLTKVFALYGTQAEALQAMAALDGKVPDA